MAAKQKKKKKRKRKLEMIDYGDSPLVDHKGRSRPLYKPRHPRPTQAKRWRPRGVMRVVIGLFPGARLMATTGFTEGLPFAIVGLISLIVMIWLGARFGVTQESLRILRLKPALAVVHCGALVAALAVYELARFGACYEERTDRARAARGMASLFLPALVIAVGGPLFVELHPRFVEAVWFAALILVLGTIPAVLGSVVDLSRLFGSTRAKAVMGVVLALLVGGAVAAFFGAEDARRALATAVEGAGFTILPKLLS